MEVTFYNNNKMEFAGCVAQGNMSLGKATWLPYPKHIALSNLPY